MNLLVLFLILSLSGTSHAQGSATSWQEFLEKEVFSHTGLDKFFPDTTSLQHPWTLNRDFVLDELVPAPSDLSPVKVNCASLELFPTHPQQNSKEYLHAVWAHYDLARLSPSSYACLLKSPNKKFCQRATWANLVVMSDTFEDRCGNMYRGYWLVGYLASDESMGTLSSRGRTFYQKPDADEGVMVLGSTYSTQASDYILLTDLLSGDGEKIRSSRREALKLGFKVKNQLYISSQDQ